MYFSTPNPFCTVLCQRLAAQRKRFQVFLEYRWPRLLPAHCGVVNRSPRADLKESGQMFLCNCPPPFFLPHWLLQRIVLRNIHEMDIGGGSGLQSFSKVLRYFCIDDHGYWMFFFTWLPESAQAPNVTNGWLIAFWVTAVVTHCTSFG